VFILSFLRKAIYDLKPPRFFNFTSEKAAYNPNEMILGPKRTALQGRGAVEK